MKRLHLRPATSLLILAVSLTHLEAQQTAPQPIAARGNDIDARRDSIHKELDENEIAVKDLYLLLDATPEADAQARRFLEMQIHQFDDRGTVLFEELDAIDRHEYEQDRRHDLKLQANRLEEEARQLRKTGHILPAALQEAKSNSIKKSLDNGTWKLLVDKEWTCQDAPAKQHGQKLLAEIQELKSETAALRKEVKLLRELLTKFTKQKGLSKQP